VKQSVYRKRAREPRSRATHVELKVLTGGINFCIKPFGLRSQRLRPRIAGGITCDELLEH
jgi:hypothetical protein